MIVKANIQNFRGFKETELDGLRRINIIVGDNGAGKTALLEAIFLGCANNPQTALSLRGARNAESPSGTGTPQEFYDAMFLDFFNNFERDKPVIISLKTDHDLRRTLKFYYASPDFMRFPIKDIMKPQSSYVPIVFEWAEGDAEPVKITPQIEPQGFIIPSSPAQKYDATFLHSRGPLYTSQNAKLFSDISKQGNELKFISTIKSQFTDIESMSVEVEIGNPAIFIKYPWSPRKVPLYLASDGLNKIVTILLFIAHSAGSYVFIDEIENGIHFSRHERLWRQLLDSARAYDTQLFLTTHSWEYLKSLSPIMLENPDDFSLIQVYRQDNISQAITVPGKDAGAALENEIDVRGISH